MRDKLPGDRSLKSIACLSRRFSPSGVTDVRTFERGKAYFHDGVLGGLDADEQEVRARVKGTQRYRIRLATGADDELEYEWDCRSVMKKRW